MFNVKPRWLTWHIPNAECNTIYLSVHCRLGYNCSDCSVTYFRPPGFVLGLWNSIRCFLSLLLPFLRCPLIDSHWNMITNYILLVVSCIYNFKTLLYLLKPVLTKDTAESEQLWTRITKVIIKINGAQLNAFPSRMRRLKNKNKRSGGFIVNRWFCDQ